MVAWGSRSVAVRTACQTSRAGASGKCELERGTRSLHCFLLGKCFSDLPISPSTLGKFVSSLGQLVPPNRTSVCLPVQQQNGNQTEQFPSPVGTDHVSLQLCSMTFPQSDGETETQSPSEKFGKLFNYVRGCAHDSAVSVSLVCFGTGGTTFGTLTAPAPLHRVIATHAAADSCVNCTCLAQPRRPNQLNRSQRFSIPHVPFPQDMPTFFHGTAHIRMTTMPECLSDLPATSSATPGGR